MATPVLSPASDDAPCARVDVLIEGLAPEVTEATLWKTVAGRRSAVRGALNTAVSGVLSTIDFEAPLDVEATYQAQLYASGVEAGWSDAVSTRVVSPYWPDGFPRILIHNPLDPATAVWVHPGRAAFSSLPRPTPGEVRWSEGARLGMVQSGRRRGLTGVPFDVVTETREDADRFDALFGTVDTPRLPILCVRVPEELQFLRMPPVWFAGVLDVEPMPDTTIGSGQVVWRMVADEVAAPVPSLVTPLLTRADIAAYYPSRQAVADANPSRLAVSRRYEIAGSGGA